MADEPERDAVLTRLDELVALLRSVDLRLRELVEAQGRADRLGPLVGGGADVGPAPRRFGVGPDLGSPGPGLGDHGVLPGPDDPDPLTHRREIDPPR